MVSLPYPCPRCQTPLYNYNGACHNTKCRLTEGRISLMDSSQRRPVNGVLIGHNVRLTIVGTLKDEHRHGRVCYFVHPEGDECREHDPMAEDWLEAW